MLVLLLWWSAIILETAILLRGFQQRSLLKYPFFYLYIASLLLSDGPLYLVYVLHPAAYPKWNWDLGFINIVLGCGVLLEIFRHVLAPYPGAEKFARISSIIIFMVIFSFGLAYLIFAKNTFEPRLLSRLERNLLAVQSIFLISLIAVVCYYRIAMGRNLRGMVVGYGLCTGVTLMVLALRTAIGQHITPAWILIQPFAYDLALGTWGAALWRYEPNPGPRANSTLESDYESVVEATESAIGAMRSHLERAARP